uniref:(northern house mosquito) hypothetical protein n=1 Tax=Culex pipiens TaxID=7175 RepID=A0A8D8MUN5_CULPI
MSFLTMSVQQLLPVFIRVFRSAYRRKFNRYYAWLRVTLIITRQTRIVLATASRPSTHTHTKTIMITGNPAFRHRTNGVNYANVLKVVRQVTIWSIIFKTAATIERDK